MPKLIQITIYLVVGLLLQSCDKTPETNPESDVTTPNILLIIADDLGKEALNGYSEGIIKANTPNIDAIRTSGMTFNNFWANPTCTPTRASIITGKYGYRTGVKKVGDILKTSETILQKYISINTNNKYASAVIGKWHLSGNNVNTNPESFGIDYYAGLIRGTVDDYYNWQLTEDGIAKTQTKYSTEYFTDLAINWVANQTKPWFLWLAYNAPHTPFHVPPAEMHKQGALAAYTAGNDPMPYYIAAIEAMDYQIGRLLANMSESTRKNTVIVFIGDNGTVNQVAQSPFTSNTVKSTLYQGGVNVPMFISGHKVTRLGIDNNLITSTDLFSTISEIAGITIDQSQDSKSFKSLLTQSATIRKFQYSEISDETSESWAISNGTYKLIVKEPGSKQLFHLTSDPFEKKNLLTSELTFEAEFSMAELETELANIRK
jgi:arylsulfatase B